jgi:hypothetical protein
MLLVLTVFLNPLNGSNTINVSQDGNDNINFNLQQVLVKRSKHLFSKFIDILQVTHIKQFQGLTVLEPLSVKHIKQSQVSASSKIKLIQL